MHAPDLAVALLVGGQTRRLPQKLTRKLGDGSLLQHARSLAEPFGTLYILGREEQRDSLDLAATKFIADRTPDAGPLRTLRDACEVIWEHWVLALAADLPALTEEALGELIATRTDAYDAVVPQHEGGIEPLCALYRRPAFLRAALGVGENLGPRALLDRMRTRYLPLPSELFLNINTEADWSHFQEQQSTR
ncbi:MAG TPA: NTP transferase domain-containing protein [Candidatus Dormibacteraeota bacterium]|nr:NTP transferase domain-containing protein [Candidatus Dormibacteraeota bacterium]